MSYKVFTLGTLKHRTTSPRIFKYRLIHYKNGSLNSPVIWESNKNVDDLYDVGGNKYDNWLVHEIQYHNDSNIVEIYIAENNCPQGDE